MKVAVYSGEIPSTTFIERLIVGLAEGEIEVLLHGKKNKTVHYDSNKVKVIGFGNSLSKLFLAVKYFLLFVLVKPDSLLKLKKHYPQKTNKSFINWFVINAPIVWHKPDIFHLQWAKGIEDFIFLKEFGIKLILSLRGTHINLSPLVDESIALIYTNNFPNTDAFHGVSQAICREAEKYGATSSRCSVVYSGLDIGEFNFQTHKKADRTRIKIISVGRPHWIKGYDIALDAMRILKEENFGFEYLIIGGKDEELLYQINDLELNEQVWLDGNRSFDEVKNIVSRSDILLMSSVEEGIPNVILEAMALGTIVISTDCGGVSEVIEDGKNGFIVPIRDARAIAEKVIELQKMPESEIEQIRLNARQTIEKQHNHQKMVDDMKNLYNALK